MAEMFIIVPPLNSCDNPTDEAKLQLGCNTLGRTAGEAWMRQTQGDRSKVQAWHDRGYRLRRVEVNLVPEAEDGPA